MWVAQIVVFTFLALVVLGVLWGAFNFLLHRPKRSRSQRTMNKAQLDTAADALANPDPDRKDTRPHNARFQK